MSEKRVSRRELARRNKKKSRGRRNFRALVTVAITAVLLYITGLYGAFLAYFGDFISEGMMLLQLGGGYPVSGDFSKVLQAEPMGTGLRVLDPDSFSVYSPTGKKVFSYSHSMANPVIATSGNRALLYNLNETSLKVANGHNILFQQDVGGNIVHACISKSNRVAVTCRSSGYNGQVTVYNYNMKERFTWYCAKAFPVYCAFSDNGKTLAAVRVQTDGGLLKSMIYIIDGSTGRELYSIDDSDYPLTAFFVSNSRLRIVYSEKLILWNVKDNRKTAEYSLGGDRIQAVNHNPPYIALCRGGKLTLLTENLAEKFSVSMDEAAKDISISQSRVFVLGEDNMYEYDYEGRLVSKKAAGPLVKMLADYGGTMEISSSGIEKVESTRSSKAGD